MGRSRLRNNLRSRAEIDSPEKKEGARILPFRRGININIGLVIFLFIFLYLLYSLVHFMTKGSYTTFQVGMPGSLSEDLTYQAVLLREETVVNSEYSGYVDLYIQEGGRASAGVDIASVDEVGSYSEQIREAMAERKLSTEDLLRMKTSLKELSQAYSGMNFSAVYERKSMLRSAVLDSIVSELYGEVLSSASAAEFFHVSECGESGLTAYYHDGFEGKAVTDLTAADFDMEKYKRERTQDLVAQGDFLYKLVTSENWTLAVPISAEEAARYGQSAALGITFLKNGLKTTAASSVVTGADGSYFLKLDLSRYLIQFISDRFARIRISMAEESGYKLPVTSLTKENFYMIPLAYKTDAGFIKVTYENAAEKVEVLDPLIAYEDEEYCYIALNAIESGTILAKTDSDERYTVRLTAELEGVYKISKGFTEFCPVVVLDRTDDYILAAKNTRGGVSAYDAILLNAKGYTSGQILQ